MNNQDKKIPYSLDAENYILGCMFVEPNIVGDVLNRIGPESFYSKPNANIVQAISNLHNNNEIIDISKVTDELERLKLLEATGGNNYLFELIASIPTVTNIEAYIEIIEEKKLLRELYFAAQKIQNDVLNGELPFEIVGDEAEKQVQRVVEMRRTSEVKKIFRFTDQVLEIIEKNLHNDSLVTGLDTGYEELNKLTFGFHPGELLILAARPGIGKSTFALNIASNACKNVGASVAFFSLEMGVDQLTMRLFSEYSGIPLSKLRSGKLSPMEMTALMVAKSEVDKLDLFLDDSSESSINEIRAKCLKLKRENKLDLVVIDYLQLVNVLNFKGNRVEEVGRISRALKNMARELEVPVLALSQLSRKSEDDGRPRLSHLRESGSIEQDADIVMFLHREQAKPDEENRPSRNHRTEVIVAKNRQGQTDSFNLMFIANKSSFSSISNKANQDQE